MLPNQEFNVLVMPKETPNCFSVVCRDTNRLDNRLGMTINHSASNNNPNALLLVTQNYGTTYNNNSQFVFFTKGKWLIANNNYFFPLCETEKSLMPLGAKFNVLVMQKDQLIVTGYPKASAFMHKTTHIPPAANIEYIMQHVSGFISPENSAFNADPNFLIFATPSSGWAQEERPAGAPIGFSATDSPLAAVLSRSNHKWAIVNASTIPFKEGTLINVLAMKSIK
jgi:hypothetical protein